MNDKNTSVIEIDNGDEPMSNHSDNEHFSSILEKRLSRREVLAGSLGVAVTSIFGLPGLMKDAEAARQTSIPASLLAGRPLSPALAGPSLNFPVVPISRSDTVTVPTGYRAQPLAPWGMPITGTFPEFKPDGSNTGEEQEQQIGSHHDGMHYYPFQDDPNGHGLIALNHEYMDPNVFNANGPSPRPRPADEVRKEIAGHGVSVIEVKKDAVANHWEVVRGSYNRRITAGTEMEISGPVRGSDLVKTKFSPDGTKTRGTINNCAHGITPWDTYLTCEENWAGYFTNKTGLPREHSRYGVRTGNSRYSWETADNGADEFIRFDASIKANSPVEDYRNEPNNQGWIVEIDPFDPNSKPIKRTAMGRFAHETTTLAPPKPGQPLTYYSGDDARNEYIYKFVTKARFRKGMRGEILDEGTLYVAKFNDNGTGEWLPLDINDRRFRAAAQAKGIFFQDQADVLVNTRLAADVAGATRMDRPEWIAVHPHTNEVYCALTNNSQRAEDAVDAANPRPRNPYGHIIRWREQGNRGHAKRFFWSIFVLAGPESDSQVLPGVNGPALTPDNIFTSPDGVRIDDNGILWITTDMSGNQQSEGPFGNNATYAANPVTGQIKRFLVGPVDCEITATTSTPDNKTMFVGIQHPGDRSQPNVFTSNWPETPSANPGNAVVLPNPSGARPRSALVAVSRDDRGVIGL